MLGFKSVIILISLIKHFKRNLIYAVSFLCLVSTLFIVVASAAPAQVENIISGMRFGKVSVGDVSGLRLVIETTQPSKAKLLLLRDPYRLVIDMPQTSWQVNNLPHQGNLSVNPAYAYRFGTSDLGTGRLVIELSQPSSPVRAFVLPSVSGGHRFVIDLVDSGETAFLVAAAALDKNKGFDFVSMSAEEKALNAPTKSVRLQMKLPKSKNDYFVDKGTLGGDNSSIVAEVPKFIKKSWVVFIDAGHGGKDPGAIGKSGAQEKKITLAAAHDLAKQLYRTGKITPILSRSDDSYLKLRERIALARRQQSDLFISLHADSAQSDKARGISVFTLSDKASDKEAAALARNENQADLIGGPDLGAEDLDAAGELLRMFQRESMNQSSYLAVAILNQISDLPGGNRRGHRFAGFAVLKAPDMPSVLVEMGFLSNSADEKNLLSNNYLRRLNRRLTKAVVSYLSTYGPELQ